MPSETDDYERICHYLGTEYTSETQTIFKVLNIDMYEVNGISSTEALKEYRNKCTADGYTLEATQAWRDPGYVANGFYAKKIFYGRFIIVVESSTITSTNESVSSGSDTDYYPINSGIVVITSHGTLRDYAKYETYFGN